MNYLDLREQKEKIIRNTSQSDRSILSVRINVPGEHKKFEWSYKIHRHACALLELNLVNEAIKYEQIEESFCNNYYEILTLYKIESDPWAIKKIAMILENQDDFGRLLDIDVYDSSGQCLSRDDLNVPTRKCFICDEPAFMCGRTRKHTIQELHEFMILIAEKLKDK